MAETLPYEYYVTLVILMTFLYLSCFADREKFVAQTVNYQEHCSTHLIGQLVYKTGVLISP